MQALHPMHVVSLNQGSPPEPSSCAMRSIVSMHRGRRAPGCERCPPASGCGSGGNAAVWRAAALSGCTATTRSGRLLVLRSCLPSFMMAASICLHEHSANQRRTKRLVDTCAGNSETPVACTCFSPDLLLRLADH